jgi:Sulfotransferase domain
VNVIAELDHVELWERALDGDPPWQHLLAGCRSTVDWPGGYFFAELLDSYPDAKVLLSVRDPEAWERSFRETIWTMCHGDTLMPLLSRARAEVDPGWRRYLEFVDRMFWGPQGTFSAGHARPVQLIEQMVAHNELVESVVPSEQLLVWEVTDGWEPLCAFLGVDVPEGPLPHANDREAFVERVIGGALDALGLWRERSVPARV